MTTREVFNETGLDGQFIVSVDAETLSVKATYYPARRSLLPREETLCFSERAQMDRMAERSDSVEEMKKILNKARHYVDFARDTALLRLIDRALEE